MVQLGCTVNKLDVLRATVKKIKKIKQASNNDKVLKTVGEKEIRDINMTKGTSQINTFVIHQEGRRRIAEKSNFERAARITKS